MKLAQELNTGIILLTHFAHTMMVCEDKIVFLDRKVDGWMDSSNFKAQFALSTVYVLYAFANST